MVTESREQRITTLATTLRSSGIARSDSQARMMAEEMIGVEEHVQQSYEVEHARAHEYLQTAKNLGMPRQVANPEPKVESKPESSRQEPSRQFEELYTSATVPGAKREFGAEHTDVNFGGKTLSQAFDHDTHNPALEAIKTQVSRDEFVPVDDVISKPIKKDIVEDSPTVEDSTVEIIEAPEAPRFSKIDMVDTIPKETHEEISIPKISKEELHEKSIEEPVQEPKLDTQKLIDLMEEDGKLEEHTREIKEKPKDVKPKEAYEENNIDLGNMFNFNKR